ncbi:MAG: hypothetical protein IPH24_17780 [Crocinitomicaceae bacterium]|nr:hypothetical protein [Crocinitomicaceae bacterium]
MSANQKTPLIFHSPKSIGSKTNPEILRIMLHPEFTKVDFGYQATDHYIKGGWIRIDRNSFIEVVKTSKRYRMLRAENIPIAPEQLHFESTKDWRYFTLYFEPLPLAPTVINIIEDAFGNENDFNYYQVNLTPKGEMEVRV